MELKWILAVGTEAAFWTLFLAFLLLRYRYARDGASIVVLAAIVLDHVVLLALAVWDFTETGAVSPFTVAILALLVYAFTLGRRDMARVDGWAKRRFSPRSRRAGVRPGRPEARCAPLPPR
jgi:hypothetical protein